MVVEVTIEPKRVIVLDTGRSVNGRYRIEVRFTCRRANVGDHSKSAALSAT
jgi:hypothetical protein